MRGAIAAERLGRLPGVPSRDFRRVLARGLNLGDAAVVRGVLERAGLDAERIAAASEEHAVKDALRVSTETAVARGAFGAPTFFVGDQMFWGNDRLLFVEQALNARFVAHGARGVTGSMDEAKKPVAVVVGVGAGLGTALARRFASAYTVALVARGAEKLEELAGEIKAAGGARSRSRPT